MEAPGGTLNPPCHTPLLTHLWNLLKCALGGTAHQPPCLMKLNASRINRIILPISSSIQLSSLSFAHFNLIKILPTSVEWVTMSPLIFVYRVEDSSQAFLKIPEKSRRREGNRNLLPKSNFLSLMSCQNRFGAVQRSGGNDYMYEIWVALHNINVSDARLRVPISHEYHFLLHRARSRSWSVSARFE